MPNAWITDLWVKDALIDEHRVTPTAAQLRAIKSLPEPFRSARFGQGKRWRVTWIDPNTNTRRSQSFTRRTDADALAAELEDDIRSGRYTDPAKGRMTFNTLADIWLASKTKIKGASEHRYTRDLDRWVRPKWGHTAINEITRQGIEAWVNELRAGTAPISATAKRRTLHGLAPNTIDGIVTIAFGAPIRYAVEERWLQRNPLANVELPTPEPSDDLHCLTHAEVEALATAATLVKTPTTGRRAGRPADGILIRLLAYTGLRINEALALKWADVDLTARRIHVRHTWTIDKHGKRTLGLPKTWERRSVPLPEFLTNLLETIRPDPAKGWVFTGARGEAVNDKNWRNRVWTVACTDLGLDDITIHHLRHTAASLAIAAGADVKVIQRMLGHASASITLDVYGHLWGDRLDEVAQALTKQRDKAITTTHTTAPDATASGATATELLPDTNVA